MRLFRVAPVLIALSAAALLHGCGKGPDFVAKDEPWRADDERACIAANVVAASPFVQQRSALGGPSTCGALRPYDVAATASGRVSLKPAATLRCPMVPAVDHWVRTVVEPAAQRHFGAPIAELKVAASYACRPMNHQSGGRLSEHGYANALDVSSFHLTDGRVITVKGGWNGAREEQAFLRQVHGGACATFNTVLGPKADSFHHDHFHLDLARHGRDGQTKICK
jgi:hypothetical protein